MNNQAQAHKTGFSKYGQENIYGNGWAGVKGMVADAATVGGEHRGCQQVVYINGHGKHHNAPGLLPAVSIKPAGQNARHEYMKPHMNDQPRHAR